MKTMTNDDEIPTAKHLIKTPPKAKLPVMSRTMFREKPHGKKHGVEEILSGKQWKPYIYRNIWESLGIHQKQKRACCVKIHGEATLIFPMV